ncbi:hypothetical protein LguiB_008261 [Lonicera macranthoides]
MHSDHGGGTTVGEKDGRGKKRKSSKRYFVETKGREKEEEWDQRPARPQPRNIYPHGFVSGSSRSASQRVTHPGIALILYSLNFGVLMGSEARLLPNGNFEYGPKSWQMKGTKVTKHNGIPNWEISGFLEYIKSGQKQGDMLLVVPEGDFAVRLGEEASIKTKVQVTKGTFYALTFSASRTCAKEERLNILVSPNSEPNDWGILPTQTIYSSDDGSECNDSPSWLGVSSGKFFIKACYDAMTTEEGVHEED